MAILALENDPARAKTIRLIVCDLVGEKLTLVRSRSELLQALTDSVPDLILLPALLSHADETELISHVSTLNHSGHLELLFTPFAFATEPAPPVEEPRGWRKWFGPARRTPEMDQGEVERGCEPAAFAEQLACSLHRVRTQRERHYADFDETPVSADAKSEIGSPSDRRAHSRFRADELKGLRTARIKNGPAVRLVDCSAGGALLETDVPLPADSEAVLELDGEQGASVIPFRVIRSQVAAGESRSLYWGACAFERPVELADLLRPQQPERLDLAIKRIVRRYASVSIIREADATELADSLEQLGRPELLDSTSTAIDGLLSVIVAALRGQDHTVTSALIEDHLRIALPGMMARFASAPAATASTDHEIFYVRVPVTDDGSARVLNIELPRGAILEDWQFRLLDASAQLGALIRDPEPAHAEQSEADAKPKSGRDRRKHVRVAGRFDGRRVGGVSMPIVVHDMSIAGCFVDSLYEEQEGRALTLEIHFPDEGTLTFKSEIVVSRPGYGFAVHFTEMSENTRASLARVIARRMGPGIDSQKNVDLKESMIA